MLEKNNAMAQTGVTLFYTINPFGPRAEGVLRVILFVCLFVMSSVVHHEDERLIVFLKRLDDPVCCAPARDITRTVRYGIVQTLRRDSQY